MTEDEARAWVETRFGNTALGKMEALVRLVTDENKAQNLIAPSTVDQLWTRHVADSAQLALFDRRGPWLDVGTGGGFPGLVVAMLRDDNTLLVEPRRRRATFLAHCAEQLALQNVEIVAKPVERLSSPARIISARAVASIDKLLHMGSQCATTHTRWILPRGRINESELERLKERWSGMFHVEQSVTEPSSAILVLDELCPK